MLSHSASSGSRQTGIPARRTSRLRCPDRLPCDAGRRVAKNSLLDELRRNAKEVVDRSVLISLQRTVKWAAIRSKRTNHPSAELHPRLH